MKKPIEQIKRELREKPSMGINVKSDAKAGLSYADLIVDGHKAFESRNSDTLRPYVGKRVAIVRTGEGPAKAIGEVTIGEPMVVNKKRFRELEGHHLVPEGSQFDINTKTKHLYPMHDPVRYDKEKDVGHGIIARKVINMAKGGNVSVDQMRHELRAKGLDAFLKPSVEKGRFYHGTNRDFHMFAPSPSRGATFVTPDPAFANQFLGDFKNNRQHNQNIMPVHVQVTNPFDYENPSHMHKLKSLVNKHMPYLKDVVERIGDHEHNWEAMEDPEIQHFIKHMGHDAFYAAERGTKNLGMYDPKKIKSAISNSGAYDVKNPDITKAKGGVAHMSGGGNMNPKFPSVQEMIQRLQEAGRIPIVPAPNRWFADPVKHPFQQKMIERVLAQTGQGREGFPSGSYINPQTGEPMDFDIMHDLGVAIDPNTGRPMMSGIKSDLTEIDPRLGSVTKSNLVRKGLFKHEGGDELLKNLAFLATIEKSGKGHHYGLSTHYESPAQLVNTMTGQNPTLRPHSRGDIFGVGDEVGRISIQGKHHPVYEKLLVAPAGSNVQGKKLHKAHGGITHAHHLEIEERPL